MNGILGYGVYVPHWRLDNREVYAFHGGSGGQGTRAVASYDEDTTTMAVEAAQKALAPRQWDLGSAYLVTGHPAYAVKSNASLAHAALGLSRSVHCADLNGGPRSAYGALLSSLRDVDPTIVMLSDEQVVAPGGGDEVARGDGAVAFVTGPVDDATECIAEYLGSGSCSEELLDRWRAPGDVYDAGWEERFALSLYPTLMTEALSSAVDSAGIALDDIARLVVVADSSRSSRAFAKQSGLGREKIHEVDDNPIGHAGVAQLGIAMADVLENSSPGDIVGVVLASDGADVLLLRVGRGAVHQQGSLSSARSGPSARVPYSDYLAWTNQLTKAGPRRPPLEAVAAPPAYRSRGWKFHLEGSRCRECDTLHLPPQRVCMACRVLDAMEPESVAGRQGTVATYSVDHLAAGPVSPIHATVVDFDGGGRYMFECADAPDSGLHVGMRVVPTLRRLSTARGIHNYFWKVKPQGGAR